MKEVIGIDLLGNKVSKIEETKEAFHVVNTIKVCKDLGYSMIDLLVLSLNPENRRKSIVIGSCASSLGLVIIQTEDKYSCIFLPEKEITMEQREKLREVIKEKEKNQFFYIEGREYDKNIKVFSSSEMLDKIEGVSIKKIKGLYK